MNSQNIGGFFDYFKTSYSLTKLNNFSKISSASTPSHVADLGHLLNYLLQTQQVRKEDEDRAPEWPALMQSYIFLKELRNMQQILTTILAVA
jgi:hypothetical protein